MQTPNPAGPAAFRPAAVIRPSWPLMVAPGAVILLLAVPLLGGLAATGLAAADGAAWQVLVTEPGLLRSALLSLWTALAATLLSVLLAGGMAAGLAALPGFGRMAERAALVMVAAPHAAVAVGLALLIAPTGLIFRAISGGGGALPPDLAVPGDRFGLALIVGLVLKETPFLLALLLAAQARLGAGAVLARARCLGWRPASAWWRVVAPQIWPVLRWPVVAVLVYGIGTVDMAVVLGPSLPPSFAVRSLSLLFDADPARAAAGHAAALAQLALAAVAVGIWWLGARLARFWLAGGRGDHPARIDPPLVRRPPQPVAPALSGLSGLVGGLALLLAAASLATLVIWALAASWRFPDLLPMRWAPDRLADTVALLGNVIARTVWLGLLPVAIALPLAVLVLEREALGTDGGTGAGRSLSQAAEALVYLPLLLPPAAFLAGIRALALRLGLDGTVMAVVWCHLLYVFPYLFLALRESYRRTDPRPRLLARSLGRGAGGAWVAVMLPLTARPMAIATAIGFAVGVAQYLPALMIGGGRLPVLATEAVAAASGIDRRAASTAALLMTVLPAIGFLLASLIRAPARAVRQ
ncbi:hypothetical protein WG926_06350 [Tistrella sp. BH-R2-4]|uniref:ABC transmembrane type-1 domain-containing protein n=1 Tax=Tistrella arctica TaxID=3133430 RepID=A0ABU9YGJ3_9PROT